MLARQRLRVEAARVADDADAREVAQVREVLATKLIAVSEIRRDHDKKYKELFAGARAVEAHYARNFAMSNTGDGVHALYAHRLNGKVVATAKARREPFKPKSQYFKDIGVSGATLAQACEQRAHPPPRFETPEAMWDYIQRSTDETYVVAEQLLDVFGAFVKDCAVKYSGGTTEAAAGALPKIAPVKDPVRILEKTSDAFSDISQVRDVLRASILCDSAAQVRAAVEGLLRDLDEAPDMTAFDDKLVERIRTAAATLANDVDQAKRQWDQLARLGAATAATTSAAGSDADDEALAASVRDATAELFLAVEAMARVADLLRLIGGDQTTVDAANAVCAQLTAAQTLRAACAQDKAIDVRALRKELRRWAGRARAAHFLATAGADDAAAMRLLGHETHDHGDSLVVRVLELKNKFAQLDPTHFRFVHFVLLLSKGTTVMPVELQVHHAGIKELNDNSGGHGHYETLRVRPPVCRVESG
jgi:hypothetical protein